MLPRPTTRYGPCPVKGCAAMATEGHHILYREYDGKDVVRGLCHEHHSWITRAQAHQGRKQHHALSVKQRWFFWFELIEGRMKRPRRTKKDIEREENWLVDHGTPAQRSAILRKWNGG
jgi:hypothetical protein